MANTYLQGSQVNVAGVFKINGTLNDPTTVTVKYRDPDGNTTTNSSPNNPSTGNYNIDIIVNIPGQWTYQFNGVGAVIANGENFFIVDPKVL